MNANQYREAFATPPSEGNGTDSNSRAARALAAALDIRKFEVDLYWKRATYFWAFIAAAFAGYGLTYRTVDSGESWLSLLFSSLGLIFAFAWFLVNKGSKFWQNNWERHVDLLEDITLGPLYRVIAVNSETTFLTAAGQFSVTRINQLLSFFVTVVWLLLFVKATGPNPFSSSMDWFRLVLVVLTACALGTLWVCGRSQIGHGKSRLIERTYEIEDD